MPQLLTTMEEALKEYYLPAWKNLLGIEPSAFLSKIRKVPVVSDKIVASAPIGLSGGFGFGAEGQNTPASGNQRFARFITDTKDMYVNVEISQKAIDFTSSAGSMADALKTEMDAAYATAKWNVGRALFGNGSGILAVIKTANSTANKNIVVDDVSTIKEGLTVDVYNASKSKTGGGYRVDAVSRTPDSNGYYTVTLDTAVATVANGFLTVQNSYKIEIDGLGSIFDDTVESIYGMSKSANPFLKPITEDANHLISDSILTRALRKSDRDKGARVDMLLMGDNAYDGYLEYLRTNNVRVEERTGELDGGFKSVRFLHGGRNIDIVNEQFVPPAEAWGIDTAAMELHQTDWSFADRNTGGIFTLLESRSVYRALLYNYGNLICKNPGGCIRIYNCV